MLRFQKAHLQELDSARVYGCGGIVKEVRDDLKCTIASIWSAAQDTVPEAGKFQELGMGRGLRCLLSPGRRCNGIQLARKNEGGNVTGHGLLLDGGRLAHSPGYTVPGHTESRITLRTPCGSACITASASRVPYAPPYGIQRENPSAFRTSFPHKYLPAWSADLLPLPECRRKDF